MSVPVAKFRNPSCAWISQPATFESTPRRHRILSQVTTTSRHRILSRSFRAMSCSAELSSRSGPSTRVFVGRTPPVRAPYRSFFAGDAAELTRSIGSHFSVRPSWNSNTVRNETGPGVVPGPVSRVHEQRAHLSVDPAEDQNLPWRRGWIGRCCHIPSIVLGSHLISSEAVTRRCPACFAGLPADGTRCPWE